MRQLIQPKVKFNPSSFIKNIQNLREQSKLSLHHLILHSQIMKIQDQSNDVILSRQLPETMPSYTGRDEFSQTKTVYTTLD